MSANNTSVQTPTIRAYLFNNALFVVGGELNGVEAGVGASCHFAFRSPAGKPFFRNFRNDHARYEAPSLEVVSGCVHDR